MDSSFSPRATGFGSRQTSLSSTSKRSSRQSALRSRATTRAPSLTTRGKSWRSISPISLIPVGPLPDDVQAFAVTASSPYPNPELAGPPRTTSNGVAETFSGKLVLVKFEVQVPPTTPINAEIFITTDQSGWNPQAIQMQRIDALHFVVVREMASGTILHYLYTRGTLQTEETGPNGLSLRPRELSVNDSDTNSTNSIVASWADANANNILQQPSVFPTPYNPAPFPNLPNGTRTPHPSTAR